MGRFVKKIKNKQYGQAMAEFALTIPVFLLLVFGVIELSRFFLVYSSVYTAAREASRYGSAAGTSTRTIDDKEEKIFQFEDCFGIKETAVRMGNFGGVQDNDVTIYYESTPGTIVASCPDNNPETVPIEDVCVSDGCVYTPKLGDRVLVEIVTDFDTLLGIVPDLPVRATNGRTIMKSITVAKEPEPIDLCSDVVEFQDQIQEGEEKILYVDVTNSSDESAFLIYRIEHIIWEGTPKLMEIKWTTDENRIWISDDAENGSPAPITIPEEGSIDYWKEHTRTLPKETTNTLEFVFSDPVEQADINLKFDLIMQNSSLPMDFCWPVEFKE